MAESEEPETLFLSYGREDRALVTAVAKLVRTATTNTVFRDEESIPPGAKWEQAIEGAICRSSQVYVFWCEHAAASEWVEREYNTALELGKKIIPVLSGRRRDC